MKRLVILFFILSLYSSDKRFEHTLTQINVLMDSIITYKTDNKTVWNLLKSYAQELEEHYDVSPLEKLMIEEALKNIQKSCEIYDERMARLSKK